MSYISLMYSLMCNISLLLSDIIAHELLLSLKTELLFVLSYSRSLHICCTYNQIIHTIHSFILLFSIFETQFYFDENVMK